MRKPQIKATIYDKRGRVLSVGTNSYVKTHPRQALLASRLGTPAKQYLHAEVSAIVRCKNLDKASRISIERYGRSGQPLLSKPCAICEEAIRLAGIPKIEYTVG